ncbi:brahma-like protein [Cryptosporidium canis]|nr:brahma-like protein [Cryptosporidium canis]
MSVGSNRIMNNDIYELGSQNPPLNGGHIIPSGINGGMIAGQKEGTVSGGVVVGGGGGGYMIKQPMDMMNDSVSGKHGGLNGGISFTHAWYPEMSKILYDISKSNLSIQDKRVRILLLIFQWIKKQQCELVDPSVLFSDENIEIVENQLKAYKHFLTSDASLSEDILEKSICGRSAGTKRQKLSTDQYGVITQSSGVHNYSADDKNEGNDADVELEGFQPDWDFINSVIRDFNQFNYKVPPSRQGSSIIARNPNQWIEYNRKVEQNRMALLMNKSVGKNSGNHEREGNDPAPSNNQRDPIKKDQLDLEPANSRVSERNYEGDMATDTIQTKLEVGSAITKPEITNEYIDIPKDCKSQQDPASVSIRVDEYVSGNDKGNKSGVKISSDNENTKPETKDNDLLFMHRISKLLNFQQFIRNQVIVSRYMDEMEPPLPPLKFVTARDARKNKALYQARMDGLKHIKYVEDIKRQRRQFISEVLKHSKRFQDVHRENQRSIRRVCSHVLRHSTNKERRDQNMEQQMQRARLNALRAQDEEAYLRLLHEAKNERLLELVHQTEDYMNKLGALVMEHRKQAGSAVDLDDFYLEDNQNEGEEEEETKDAEDGGDGEKGSGGQTDKHSCSACGCSGKLDETHQEATKLGTTPDDDTRQAKDGTSGDKSWTCGCSSTNCTCSTSISKCDCKSDTCCSKNKKKKPAPLIRAKERYFQVTHMIQEHITKQPECLKGGQLREYQMKGLEWLVSLYNNNLNGILADAMGLGKTVQTVSVLAHIYENKGNRGPHLIIAPLSTLHGNWENEFNKWLPDFVKVIYEGNKEIRKQIRSKFMTGEAKFHVLLTTDAFIMKDKHYLRKFDWEYIIVDEAHRLKNPKSKLVQILNNGFRAKHRLALTGTPLQNDLQEVWALLNYLMPSIFNSSETFQQWFNEPLSSIKSGKTGGGSDSGIVPLDISEEEQLLIVDRLHKVLRPFLLRREKIQVANEVPPKLEEILWCPLSGLQQYLYKQLESNENSGPNVLMQLRKVCNHPFLFSTELQYPSDESIVRVCGKFVMLDSILPKLRAAGHRVLIFSQMTKLLTLLEIFLSLRNMPFLRLDGTTLSEDRQESLKLFNAENSPYFVFLLSTKAGGFGINLQSADTVILFDSDWNPQNDEQAQSRAHRIGQKKEVLTLRFVTPDTVEERIMTTAGIKLDKDALIIKSGMYHDLYDGDDLEQKRKEKIQEILRKQRQKEVVNCYYDSDRLNRILARSDRDLEIFERVDRMRKMCHIPGLIMDATLPPCLFDWKKQAKISRVTVENTQKAEELWKLCYTYGDPWVVHPRNKSWRKIISLGGPSLNMEESDVSSLVADREGRSTRASSTLNKNLASMESKDVKMRDEEQEESSIIGSDEKLGRELTKNPQATTELKKPTSRTKIGASDMKTSEDSDNPRQNISETKEVEGMAANTWSNEHDDLTEEHITPEEIEYRRESLNDAILQACDIAVKTPEYEAYVDLPSQTAFPDYYQIISKPVCLQHIRQFAKKKEFTSLHKLEKYLERLASNAKMYNGVTHFLYHSALHLTNTIMTEVRKRVAVAFYTYKLPEGHIRDYEAKQLLDGLNSVSETDLDRKHMLVPDVGDEEEEEEEEYEEDNDDEDDDDDRDEEEEKKIRKK